MDEDNLGMVIFMAFWSRRCHFSIFELKKKKTIFVLGAEAKRSEMKSRRWDLSNAIEYVRDSSRSENMLWNGLFPTVAPTLTLLGPGRDVTTTPPCTLCWRYSIKAVEMSSVHNAPSSVLSHVPLRESEANYHINHKNQVNWYSWSCWDSRDVTPPHTIPPHAKCC